MITINITGGIYPCQVKIKKKLPVHFFYIMQAVRNHWPHLINEIQTIALGLTVCHRTRIQRHPSIDRRGYQFGMEGKDL
jgi:hypothetical protein